MRNALTNHKGHKGHEGDKKSAFVYSPALQRAQHGASVVSFVVKIFSPENTWALLLFLIVVALIILTADDSPNWIYQGF
jgi:hypothetical protein